MRSSEFSTKVITDYPLSLIICDLFPYACARLPYSRFLLLSDNISEILYGRKFRLKDGEGLLD